jgi:hypothetical protein
LARFDRSWHYNITADVDGTTVMAGSTRLTPSRSAVPSYSHLAGAVDVARLSDHCDSDAWKLSGGNPRLILARLAQYIAAAHTVSIVVLAARGVGELLAQLAGLALRLGHSAVKIVEEHLLGECRAPT